MTTKRFGPDGWTPERLSSLAGKTYLVTGANGGAGFEATRVFLSKLWALSEQKTALSWSP